MYLRARGHGAVHHGCVKHQGGWHAVRAHCNLPKHVLCRSLPRGTGTPDTKPGKQDAPTRPRRSSRGPGGQGNQGPSELQLLAGHAAYTGLIGTVAVLSASSAHVDVFHMFQWLNWQELALGVLLMVPLQVANVVIMAPDWSDWRLPTLTKEEELHERAAAAMRQGSTTSASSGDAIQPSTSLELADQPQPDAGSTATTSNTAQSNGSQPMRMVPADTWGQAKPESPSSAGQLPSRRVLRDAANLAQGNYLMSPSAIHIHPAADVLITAADSLSSELLFRGVLLTLASGWLRDRLYEAGCADYVQLPGPLSALINAAAVLDAPQIVPVEAVSQVQAAAAQMVSLDDASRWAAGAALVSFLGLLAVRRVQRSVKKVEMMADIRQRFSTVLEEQRKQRKLKQQAAEVPGGATMQAAAKAANDTPAKADSHNQESEPALQSSSQSSNTGPAKMGDPALGLAGSSLPPQIRTQRSAASNKRTPLADEGSNLNAGFDAIVWSTAFQSSRDLLQGSTLSLVFIATGGNLAACFVSSLVNQLVFTTLQRGASTRMQKRSATLVKELAEVDVRLQGVGKRAKQQLAQSVQSREASRSQQDESAAPQLPVHTGQEVVKDETAQQAAPAAVATSVVDAPPPVPATVTPFSRTLHLLDSLIPEPAPASQRPRDK